MKGLWTLGFRPWPPRRTLRQPAAPVRLSPAKAANQTLRSLKARWSRLPRPSWSQSLALLARAGLAPRTVFDIGVAFGTPALYRAFPRARYYLIDPTSESLSYMSRLARRLDAEPLNVALGDEEGEREIELRADLLGSTFYEEIGSCRAVGRETVVVRRFDRLIGAFDRPALAKIDVQGAEMAVLRGMGARIAELDAVLVETSTLATVTGGPELAELIAFMAARGFVVFDVLGLARRPLDNALAQIDLLFVPDGSPLRADRRWSGRT